MDQHEKKPDSVNDASARSASLVSRNLILTLIFAGIIILYSLFQPHGMLVEFGDTALTVTNPDNQVTNIQYADILTVEQMVSPVYGTLSAGRQSSSCWYGTYHNLLWDDYSLMIHPSCPACVVLTTSTGVFVFNGLNEEETGVYYDTLVKMTNPS